MSLIREVRYSLLFKTDDVLIEEVSKKSHPPRWSTRSLLYCRLPSRFGGRDGPCKACHVSLSPFFAKKEIDDKSHNLRALVLRYGLKWRICRAVCSLQAKIRQLKAWGREISCLQYNILIGEQACWSWDKGKTLRNSHSSFGTKLYACENHKFTFHDRGFFTNRASEFRLFRYYRKSSKGLGLGHVSVSKLKISIFFPTPRIMHLIFKFRVLFLSGNMLRSIPVQDELPAGWTHQSVYHPSSRRGGVSEWGGNCDEEATR
jgi:hypothetical protein